MSRQAISTSGFLRLSGPFELLEPERQSVAIRTILTPPQQLDHLPGDSFQPEFEKRAIMDFEQPVRDVNSVIRVDADQVGLKGRMMDLR